MTREEARQHALVVMYWKSIYGVPRETIRRTTQGFVAPGEPGFDLRAGHITVPANTRPEPRYSFDTDDLMDEIENGQGDLFGGEK